MGREYEKDGGGKEVIMRKTNLLSFVALFIYLFLFNFCVCQKKLYICILKFQKKTNYIYIYIIQISNTFII